ncbi:MAG: exodeoxyribonuclease VII small subunit [Gemmatimonadetes bacterium]|nr:exodeoxyribonuclease VII small subunit [Gemmatimonadota bacterium]
MSESGVGARSARLEQILERLEREDLELEEGLALFEEGVRHVRETERLLRVAELRVERLLERADGSIETRPETAGP